MTGRLDGRGFRAVFARRRRRRRSPPGADLYNQLGAAAAFFDELQDSLNMVLLQPVDDKSIRREEAQHAAVIDGLKGPNPGIELLLW